MAAGGVRLLERLGDRSAAPPLFLGTDLKHGNQLNFQKKQKHTDTFCSAMNVVDHILQYLAYQSLFHA